MKQPPKSQRSSMDTLILSADQIDQWRIPPFQRPLRVNEKVRVIAEHMKCEGVAISGVITLGRVSTDHAVYIVDGQHRLAAFKITGMDEIIADIRTVQFDTFADMADEFVKLNSALVRMRPDDMLRGVEPSHPFLQDLRNRCPFLGYDQLRRDTHSPLISVSVTLRAWFGSSGAFPTSSGMGSAYTLAQRLDREETDMLSVFLLAAHAAWGNDKENFRLWSILNMSTCMWIWRQTVMRKGEKAGQRRHTLISPHQFKNCLQSVSADPNYIDWLVGRALGERDRSPCYTRLKNIFAKRIELDQGKKVKMPQPPWNSR